jgi:Family of unknown function (DUF6714)
MSIAFIVGGAFEVFRTDAEAPPPLTLRGANAVDGYNQPMPFNPAEDNPTDAYLEGFAFWGLGYLDARSWRHYLPRLIDYAFRRPNDPAMVTEALVRSLRPPDRYPPRLATLSAEQEDVVRMFLEQAALDDAIPARAGRGAAGPRGMVAAEREVPSNGARNRRPCAPHLWRIALSVTTSTDCRCPKRSPQAASVVRSRKNRGACRRGASTCAGDAHTVVAVNGRRSTCARWRIRCGRAPRCFATPCRRDRL